MIDFTDEIITKINTIQDRINKKKRVIVFTKLLNEGEIDKYGAMLLEIQIIINECLQYGNYRRACKYSILADKLIKEIEQKEKKIVDKLTASVVKN